jgi:hypothetical protein
MAFTLPSGNTPGQRLVDPYLGRYVSSGALVIPGDHGRVYAHILQRGNGRTRIGLERVGHCDHPDASILEGDQHGCLPLAFQTAQRLLQGTQLHAAFGKQSAAAHAHEPVLHLEGFLRTVLRPRVPSPEPHAGVERTPVCARRIASTFHRTRLVHRAPLVSPGAHTCRPVSET